MRFYAAPMEGITGYIYRNAHASCFPSMQRYYTPFLSPNQKRTLGRKEKNDVIPEHNTGLSVIPQVLTNRADAFLRAAHILSDMGYTEINLNLGCPSATVVTKGKGAGFLANLSELNAFLEQIFEQCPIAISLKTRLGMQQPEEVFALEALFSKFPVKEWILHARVREDFYKNTPHWSIFAEVSKQSKIPICYNGDIFSVSDYQKFLHTFPEIEAIMLGRGLLINPALVREIKGGVPMCAQEFLQFHDQICTGYLDTISGSHHVLCKMKELWTYWIQYPLLMSKQKEIKKIKKCRNILEYQNLVSNLFT